jgi:hypothetical protein
MDAVVTGRILGAFKLNAFTQRLERKIARLEAELYEQKKLVRDMQAKLLKYEQ